MKLVSIYCIIDGHYWHNIIQIHNHVLQDWQHFAKYFPHSFWMWRIFCRILPVPHNIVMYLNDVMSGIFYQEWQVSCRVLSPHQHSTNLCYVYSPLCLFMYTFFLTVWLFSDRVLKFWICWINNLGGQSKQKLYANNHQLWGVHNIIK